MAYVQWSPWRCSCGQPKLLEAGHCRECSDAAAERLADEGWTRTLGAGWRYEFTPGGYVLFTPEGEPVRKAGSDTSAIYLFVHEMESYVGRAEAEGR